MITGATGFIGRRLVSHLLSEGGAKLVVAVRHTDTRPLSWRAMDNLQIVEVGPLETAKNLERVVSGVSTVIHMAGLAHLLPSNSADQAAAFDTANATATARLAQVAARANVANFIHVSSLAAIASNASPTVVDDTTYLDPSTPFGWSKRRAEEHVMGLRRQGMFAVSLRPPLVVGSDAKGNWRALQRLAATSVPLPFASVRNRRALLGVQTMVEAMSHLALGAWASDLSGNYCIADAEHLSLPEILSELRLGMEQPSCLFAFPPEALAQLLRVAGRFEVASGLLGTLEVDASRFREVFSFTPSLGQRDEIRISGAQFRRSRTGREDSI